MDSQLPAIGLFCRCLHHLQVGWGFTDATPFTQQPDLLISPQQKCEHLYSFWKQHISRPMALVGGSLGGAMALDFALAYPDAVEKLVLIDAQVCTHSKQHVPGCCGGIGFCGQHFTEIAGHLCGICSCVVGMGPSGLLQAAQLQRPAHRSLPLPTVCCCFPLYLQGFIDGIGPMASLPRPLAAAGVWVLRTEQLRMVSQLRGKGRHLCQQYLRRSVSERQAASDIQLSHMFVWQLTAAAAGTTHPKHRSVMQSLGHAKVKCRDNAKVKCRQCVDHAALVAAFDAAGC